MVGRVYRNDPTAKCNVADWFYPFHSFMGAHTKNFSLLNLAILARNVIFGKIREMACDN